MNRTEKDRLCSGFSQGPQAFSIIKAEGLIAGDGYPAGTHTFRYRTLMCWHEHVPGSFLRRSAIVPGTSYRDVTLVSGIFRRGIALISGVSHRDVTLISGISGCEIRRRGL